MGNSIMKKSTYSLSPSFSEIGDCMSWIKEHVLDKFTKSSFNKLIKTVLWSDQNLWRKCYLTCLVCVPTLKAALLPFGDLEFSPKSSSLLSFFFLDKKVKEWEIGPDLAGNMILSMPFNALLIRINLFFWWLTEKTNKHGYLVFFNKVREKVRKGWKKEKGKCRTDILFFAQIKFSPG